MRRFAASAPPQPSSRSQCSKAVFSPLSTSQHFMGCESRLISSLQHRLYHLPFRPVSTGVSFQGHANTYTLAGNQLSPLGHTWSFLVLSFLSLPPRRTPTPPSSCLFPSSHFITRCLLVSHYSVPFSHPQSQLCSCSTCFLADKTSS